MDAPARLKALSQLSIFKETKTAPVQADFMFAMTVPVGVPADVIEKINTSLRAFLQDK